MIKILLNSVFLFLIWSVPDYSICSSVADPEPELDPEGSETLVWIRSGSEINNLDADLNPDSNPDSNPDAKRYPKQICKRSLIFRPKKA